ncbi:hypothetical protein NKG05_06425 [Oerskovia sp. M15]
MEPVPERRAGRRAPGGPAASTSAGAGNPRPTPARDHGLGARGRLGQRASRDPAPDLGRPEPPGFLAAYPETQFITLETMTASNYAVVWAPYYTTHKILRGCSTPTSTPTTRARSTSPKGCATGCTRA